MTEIQQLDEFIAKTNSQIEEKEKELKELREQVQLYVNRKYAIMDVARQSGITASDFENYASI